ncbi:MAG: hypothetical protein NT169_18715 [Chloroflexi bacterium]|nr:hypothetical protein [Chloroflexota bacterium]
MHRVFELAADARPADSIKMAGGNFHRVDQGEYRIVYSFDADTVYIVVVGKRNDDDDVYKKASR